MQRDAGEPLAGAQLARRDAGDAGLAQSQEVVRLEGEVVLCDGDQPEDALFVFLGFVSFAFLLRCK